MIQRSLRMYGGRDTAVSKRKERMGKMTVRLLVLLAVCILMSVCCFRYLMKWEMWTYIELVERGVIEFAPDKLIADLQEKAKDIDFLETDQEELMQLLDMEQYDDGYTLIMFYDKEGLYQYDAVTPQVWDSVSVKRFWYDDVGFYTGMDRQGEIVFRDTTETVSVHSYHQAQIVIPYLVGALSVSMLFMLPVVFYVWNRMRYVGRLKAEILVMADGNLEDAITVKGTDEIGILARNLDEMRLAMGENIRKEQEGQQANRELISSMSHDLRTPLTTLYGYLEIVEQGKCPEEKRKEYIRRCIEKVEEIRVLSDRMFEYALVYETNEQAELSELYLEELLEELERGREFLELQGFRVQVEYSTDPEGRILGNCVFIQRMFNNLVSNILKYGEKESAVSVNVRLHQGNVQIIFLNRRRQQQEQVESNRIGLKSVKRMAELQGGSMFVAEEKESFAVTICFPLLPF